MYGERDELGTLNLLTPEVVLAAKSEIVTGETISLKFEAASIIVIGPNITDSLPLNVPIVPMNPARRPCSHRFVIKPNANDDELDINTQSSSQWDGLRHFPYQASRKFYGGFTQEDISGPSSSMRGGVHSTPARKSLLSSPGFL